MAEANGARSSRDVPANWVPAGGHTNFLADGAHRGGEQVLGQRPGLQDRPWGHLVQRAEVAQELGPGEIEEPLEPILEPAPSDWRCKATTAVSLQ